MTPVTLLPRGGRATGHGSRRIDLVGWSIVMTSEPDVTAATASTTASNPPAPSDDAPAQRYTAALARDIELRWQDWWDEHHVFEAPNPAGPLADPDGVAERGAQAVRARHVPVPLRHRPPRRPPAGLHRHRRLRPLPPHGRSQRPLHDGLRRLRPARRAVRRADRAAPGDHDGGQRGQLPPPAAPPGHEPRPAPLDRHHRPRLLPLDAVDLHPDLRELVRPRGAAPRRQHRPGPPDRRAAGRARPTAPARRPTAGRGPSCRRPSRPTSSTGTGWPTSPTRPSTGAPGWAPSSPTRRSPPTAAATAATSPSSSATCASG